MSWLVNSANLSSLKNQLSNLAKDVLADVEEAVQEAVKDEHLGDMKDDGLLQADFVTPSSSNQIDAANNENDCIASVDDEKRVVLLGDGELTSRLQISTSDASSQLTRLQRQNEILELEVKILKSNKESFQQRLRAYEKYEKEVNDLRRQLVEMQENHEATEKQLKQDLEESRKNVEAKTDELASTKLLVISMKSDIERLSRINDNLEKRIELEEREAAEHKVDEIMEKPVSLCRPIVREFPEDQKDYDDLFDRISYQIQVEESESAVNFVKKLESFLRNINSDSITKSSVDALGDGLAQLAAYEEFDIVEVSKNICQSDSSHNFENTMTQNDVSSTFASQKEFEKCEVHSQTEVSPTSDAVNRTNDSDLSSVSTSTLHDAHIGLAQIESWSSFKDMADSSSQIFTVVHDKLVNGTDAVCQTEVNLDEEHERDGAMPSDQSTSKLVDTFKEDVTSQTNFKDRDAVGEIEDVMYVKEIQSVDQSNECDSLAERTFCQTDFKAVDVTTQTETAQLIAGNQEEVILSSDKSTSSECQTGIVDITQFLQSALPILNSLSDTSYGMITAQLEAELNKVISVDQTLAQFLELMLATYREISEDLAAKLTLQNEVEKFQNERDQLLQALKQKHQENVVYHSEVQRLSKALQEIVTKRQNMVDAAVQFNGMSDLEEEVAQLREVEVLLTAEAISLRQNIEQIRKRHNKEILGFEERLAETGKKLEDANRVEVLLTTEAVNLRQNIERIRKTHNEEILGFEERLAETGKKLEDANNNQRNMEQKNDLLTKRLKILEQALDAIHKEKEIEIGEAMYRHRKNLESANQEKQCLYEEIATLEAQIRQLEGQLVDSTELENQLLKLRGTISDLQMQLERNEKLRDELGEEVRRLKESMSNCVDRYLVANLICGFFTAPSSDKQKVLNLLSTVLTFTTEEKAKCGLVEQQQPIDAKALSTAFLQFLEAESKPRPKPPSLLP